MNTENNDKSNERANNNEENHTGYINIALAYELANKNNEKNKTFIMDKDTKLF